VCAKCGEALGPDYVVPTTTSTWGGQTYYHRVCPKHNPQNLALLPLLSKGPPWPSIYPSQLWGEKGYVLSEWLKSDPTVDLRRIYYDSKVWYHYTMIDYLDGVISKWKDKSQEKHYVSFSITIRNSISGMALERKMDLEDIVVLVLDKDTLLKETVSKIKGHMTSGPNSHTI
jgi:hypothetical protein